MPVEMVLCAAGVLVFPEYCVLPEAPSVLLSPSPAILHPNVRGMDRVGEGLLTEGTLGTRPAARKVNSRLRKVNSRLRKVNSRLGRLTADWEG